MPSFSPAYRDHLYVDIPNAFMWARTLFGLAGARFNPATGEWEGVDLGGRAFDVANLKNPIPSSNGITYYVGYTGHVDTNSGLTSLLSKRTLAAALAATTPTTVFLKGGVDFWLASAGGGEPEGTVTLPARAINLIGDGGIARIQYGSKHNWTQVGTTGVYYTARTNVGRVWDATPALLDAYGDYKGYNKHTYNADDATTAAEMAPGEWAQGATNVLVKTWDGRALAASQDATIKVFLTAGSPVTTAASQILYMENIAIEGGMQTLTHSSTGVSQDARLYAKNCDFGYSDLYNVMTTLGLAYGVFQNCKFRQGYMDGANHHAQNAIVPRIIEINCSGYNNGRNGGHTNNGSSVHDGGAMIRIGGEYFGNDGPNVAEATVGTTSLNIGVNSHDSVGGTTADANFYMDGGTMWLDRCISGAGSLYDITTAATTTPPVVRHRSCSFVAGQNSLAANTLIEDY